MFVVFPFSKGHGSGQFSFLLSFLVAFKALKWNTSPKSSNFSFLQSKINVFVDTGVIIPAACGRCLVAINAIASVRRLMDSFKSVF